VVRRQVSDAGRRPEWLDDEEGWDDVADALLHYIGLEAVEELAAETLDGLFEEDPLQRLDATTGTSVADEPGLYRGHPVFAYEESIRALKAATDFPSARACF